MAGILDPKTGLLTQAPTGTTINESGVVNRPITTESLKPTPALKLPDIPQQNTSEADTMLGGAGATAQNLQTITQQLTPQPTALDQQLQDLLGANVVDTQQMAQKGADQLSAEQAQGIPQLKTQFGELNTQLAVKLAESKALDESYRSANELAKQGVYNPALLQGKQQQNYRTYLAQKNAKASEIGLLQAQAQGVSNQIELAQSTADRSINLKYSVLENNLAVRQAQLQAIQPLLSKQEKIQALAQQTLLNQQQQEINDKKQAEKDKVNYNLDLMTKYPDARIGINDSIEKAQAKVTASKIYQDQIRGPVGSQAQTGPLGLTNTQIDNIAPLVTQFQNSPIVKNYNTIGEGYNFVSSLSGKTTNPADDQALIYALAKALDPDSVVREGEYATVQKYAQSLIKSYGKSAEQAIAGTGFLSEQARKNIKETIQTRFKAAEKSYQNLTSETTRRINLIGGTDKGPQLLNNYGGAFTPIEPQQGPVQSPDLAPKEQQGFFSKLGNWLWGS